MCATARTLTVTAVAIVLSFASSPARSESLSDLKSDTEEFHEQATELYRIDKNNLNSVWEAYCGYFDQSNGEDREYAAVIGRELQYKEKGLVENYLGLARDLEDRAEDLIAAGESGAKPILEGVKREEANLQKLYDGAVLQGSNHPFVQFAVEYGKKMHRDMCDRFDDKGRACDQEFPGANGRPDLVTVANGVLTVYEFKPNNSKAKDKGWQQVGRYIDPVQRYYQKFFPNGPGGATDGEPDSYRGGREMLDALKNSSSWNGNTLMVKGQVETYDMCDNPFD